MPNFNYPNPQVPQQSLQDLAQQRLQAQQSQAANMAQGPIRQLSIRQAPQTVEGEQAATMPQTSINGREQMMQQRAQQAAQTSTQQRLAQSTMRPGQGGFVNKAAAFGGQLRSAIQRRLGR